MAGIQFHVRVHHPLERFPEGKISVKEYKLCNCITVKDLSKTVQEDFQLPNIFCVQQCGLSLFRDEVLESFMPYRDGVLDVYYV